VSPRPEAVAALSGAQCSAPPKSPLTRAKSFASSTTLFRPATMAMAGGRFFGFVIGGALPATVAASWLATAWDQNSGLYNANAGHLRGGRRSAGVVWSTCSDCLKEPSGGFVTGTTVAHITALAAARHAVLAKAGWNVESRWTVRRDRRSR